jgi:nucleoside triphosphate pyrophosphatase
MLSEPLQKYNLILASKSPRRQYLLKELGFDFEVRTKDVDESFSADLQAQEIPLYLCEKKADAFEEELNDNTVVITADTIVWVDGQVLNKPENSDDAVRMLKILSGNVHEVYTGVCLRSKHKRRSFFTLTKVYFRELHTDEIEYYVRTFKPYDKAGSYGAQECLPADMNPCSAEEIEFLTKLGKLNLISESRSVSKDEKHLTAVKKIDGSYFNVMGLPLKELYLELQIF